MVDVRKIIIIFVVSILFAVLVFSAIEAVYPRPEYNDFCEEKFFPRPVMVGKEDIECPTIEVSASDQESCRAEKGNIQYNYDENGCPVSYECSTCNNAYEEAREQYNQVVFYVSAVLALIAIFLGMYLPAKENTLNEWIGTGFMLGGAFALFFGTARSFSDLGRFVRPIVIFIELGLVVFVAYRKIGNLREDKKKR